MADCNAQELVRSLGDTIIKKFNVKGAVDLYDEMDVRFPDRILDEIMKIIPNNSTVLLIDEYDAPLTHHIDNIDELNKKGVKWLFCKS